MDKTNRYKKLLSFTLILGIGTVISKLMTYVVLTPLYTRTLTTAEFGIVELVVQTANLLMPLVCLGINQAVLRFERQEHERVKIFQLFETLGIPYIPLKGSVINRLYQKTRRLHQLLCYG